MPQALGRRRVGRLMESPVHSVVRHLKSLRSVRRRWTAATRSCCFATATAASASSRSSDRPTRSRSAGASRPTSRCPGIPRPRAFTPSSRSAPASGRSATTAGPRTAPGSTACASPGAGAWPTATWSRSAARSSASTSPAATGPGPTMVQGELSGTPRFSEQQQRILRALCRPLFADGDGFNPSSDLEVSDETGIAVDVVTQELDLLARLFGLEDMPRPERRAEVASAGRPFRAGRRRRGWHASLTAGHESFRRNAGLCGGEGRRWGRRASCVTSSSVTRRGRCRRPGRLVERELQGRARDDRQGQGRADLPADPRHRPGRAPTGLRRARCSPTATTSASPATAATPSTPACRRPGSSRCPRAERAPGDGDRHRRLHRRALRAGARGRRLTADSGPVLVTGASGGVGSTAVDILASARLRGRRRQRQGPGRSCSRSAPRRSSPARTRRATPGARWRRRAGPARSTASAARCWPASCAPCTTAAPSRPAATPAASSCLRPCSRSSCAASRCSGSIPCRPDRGAQGDLEAARGRSAPAAPGRLDRARDRPRRARAGAHRDPARRAFGADDREGGSAAWRGCLRAAPRARRAAAPRAPGRRPRVLRRRTRRACGPHGRGRVSRAARPRRNRAGR